MGSIFKTLSGRWDITVKVTVREDTDTDETLRASLTPNNFAAKCWRRNSSPLQLPPQGKFENLKEESETNTRWQFKHRAFSIPNPPSGCHFLNKEEINKWVLGWVPKRSPLETLSWRGHCLKCETSYTLGIARNSERLKIAQISTKRRWLNK